MTTNKKITYLFLDSYFIESNNQINIDYLIHTVKTWLDNYVPLYNAMRSNRNAVSVAHEAIITALNLEMNYTDYSVYYITSYQLKAWLKDHGKSWDIFQPIVNHIKETRKELEND